MSKEKFSILADIIARLKGLCEGVGGNPRPFVSHWIDITASAADVAALFHDSGLLIKDDAPVFVYIRDHSYTYRNNLTRHNRLHIVVCEKLKEMKAEGRIKRYHVTDRDDNSYPIDDDKGKMRMVRLRPCRYCLEVANYKGFRTCSDQQAVVDGFDAKEAHAFLADMLLGYWLEKLSQDEDLRSEYVSTGYASNHGEISLKHRKSKKFTCDKCQVNLSIPWWLTDTHHINGVKNDNRPQNLLCLCKLCHRAEHPHYRVKFGDAAKIKHAREEQGIAS